MEITGYVQIVPVVIGTVTVIRMIIIGGLKDSDTKKKECIKSISPLISLFLAILFSLMAYGISTTTLLNGIVTGLIASGVYSGGKSLINIKK